MILIPRYNQEIPLYSLIQLFLGKKIEFPEDYMFFNSGRSIIKWLLAELKSLSGKKLNVGMPCYVCYTVYQSVIESDNEPLLLDVNPLGFSFPDNLINQINKIDVLIWVNYFGFRYDEILKQTRSRFPDLIILEDCSQVDLRDFIKSNNEVLFSDYMIFSFNFRKPITAGRGGLLILNRKRVLKNLHYLSNRYNNLPKEKLTASKIIHLLVYNYSYNYLIFLLFNKLITKRRQRKFTPEEFPIQVFTINGLIKKLFYIQYLRISDKNNSELYTLNYLCQKSEVINDFCFGSLCYFPVKLNSHINRSVNDKVDRFLLWDDLKESYSFFDLKIKEKEFPLTFYFMNNFIFLPARLFKKSAFES